MKLFAAAAIVLLSLASSFSYAEQTTTPVRQNQRDTMILLRNITTRRLISIIWRPAMINLTNLACRTTSSTTVMPLHAYLCIAPSPGLFYPRAMPGRTRRRPKTLI